jgi:outer membrane receptor protein involved in Fe transport
MTGNPRLTTNLELAYAPPQGFGGRSSFHWEAYNYVRDIPAVQANGQPATTLPTRVKSQDLGSLDLQLSYRFNDTYKVVFDVTNVLDKKYLGNGAGSWAQGNYDFTFSPRPPRAFYLGLQMNWDN